MGFESLNCWEYVRNFANVMLFFFFFLGGGGGGRVSSSGMVPLVNKMSSFLCGPWQYMVIRPCYQEIYKVLHVSALSS